jgi:cellulose synthase/poly-beta-1,6-N-acetylglucosamine synthase-like glycosyltransferase
MDVMKLFLSFITLYGISIFLWASVGLCRFINEKIEYFRRKEKLDDSIPSGRITLDDVAVLIPAHNEEKTIKDCLEALSKVVPKENIYLGSDGSSDNTVGVVRELDYKIADIQPNGGKARTLKYLIDHFSICESYKAILIMDADSEIDKHYLKMALPLFDDPSIVAIAGHANPKWERHWSPRWSMFFIAYRVRLYKLTQALLRYGQTWKHSNVSFIVPGFASMYRCSVLPKIEITAPGLIIEDFNMTFELHHQKLGKIAYTPRVRCVCQDPHNLKDYYEQVRRWYLGFWQTIRLHGLWPSFFWLSLGMFIIEMLLQSIIFLIVPLTLVWFLLMPDETLSLWLPHMGLTEISLLDVVIGVFVADYLITIIVSIAEKKPIMMIYGFGFVFLRWIDALLFLMTLPLSFRVKSDGRWVSPSRL